MFGCDAKTKMDFLFTMNEAASITEGALFGVGELTFSSCVIDSRQASSETLFVALKGEKTDGHLYLSAAFDLGCRCFLINSDSMSVPVIQTQISAIKEQGGAIVSVENSLLGLQALAKAHLERFPNLIRIGVTGSSGKTTSKELLGAILSEKYQVCMTEGNFNSEIGLPLMALRVRPKDEILLLEMGIDHFGEMDRMAAIVKPQLALITYIGTAHIGVFGSQEVIAEQKGRIFSYFNEKSCAFVNENDSFALNEANRYPGDVQKYGVQSCQVEGEDCGILGWKLRLASGEIGQLPLYGKYNLINFCGALAVARHLGMSDDAILKGAAKVNKLFGRGAVKKFEGKNGQILLIEDCYNANGESMAGALNFFAGLQQSGRKIAVVASMKDLGSLSEKIHRQIGQQLLPILKEGRIDFLYLLGEETGWIGEELSSVDAKRWRQVESIDALKEAVALDLRNQDCWMLKGSRSMALERLESVFEAF